MAVTRMEAGKLRSSLIVQMNSELLTAMLSALARLCEAGVRPSAMTAYTEQLCEMLQFANAAAAYAQTPFAA